MAATGASARSWLIAIALLCLAAVGTALVTQHIFGMQPCPWCILQRLIYLIIAALALLAAAVPMRLVRTLLVLLALLAALAGAAAALYQHFVAAKSLSCNLTLADRIVSGLGLDHVLPAVFLVTANCAESAVTLFGVSYEFWSLALFALIGAATLRLLLLRR